VARRTMNRVELAARLLVLIVEAHNRGNVIEWIRWG